MSETTQRFSSYDGLRLEGTYREPSGRPIAAALLVHGITSDRDEWGFYSDMAAALADDSIATLRFDYRAHGVDSTPMQELSLGGIVNDIHAAFQQLVELVGTDLPKFIVGTSFGGGVSAYWAAEHSDQVEAVFLCAPVIDYEQDISKTAGNWRDSLEAEGFVDYVDNPIGRPLVNEMPHISGIRSLLSPSLPIFIFHGDIDDDVPLASSKKYAKDKGNPRLFVIDGAGHGFAVPGDEDLTDPRTKANHQLVYSRIIEIIKELNK